MADENTSEERTEEPTAKRLQKAREDGQVVRSQELSVAAMMIGVAVFLSIFGGMITLRLSEIFKSGFVFDRKDIFADRLLPSVFGGHAVESILAVTPIFLLAVIIAFAAAGMLGGFVFSAKSLAPKASKINPLNGFKRMFGTKALVDLTKAIAKFSLVGAVLYLVVSQNFEKLISLGFMNINPALAGAGKLLPLVQFGHTHFINLLE